MNPPFVKKFDFRGVYGTDIFDKDAFYLGLAIQKTLRPKKILVGWDSRVSSKSLALNIIKSFKNREIEIYFLDKCPIDYVTAASFSCDFDFSVMFTGSHNPWTWTGLLMHTQNGDSIQGELVDKIVENYNSSLSEQYIDTGANLQACKDFYPEIERIYSEKISSLIPLERIPKLKVAVDLGDGTGSRSLSLIEKLIPQVEFVRLNDRNVYDDKSSHIADPSEIENMEQLIESVKSGGYSGGFAFDSDADRMLAIDEKGNYLNGSVLGSAHVETFLSLKFDDKTFGYAVDCGLSLPNCLTKNKSEHNLEIKPMPVGRSLVRDLLRNGLDLGVENVGHFYSKDFFKTDSGAFSIVVILYWMGANGALSGLTQKYPDGLRGQIFTKVLDEDTVDKIKDGLNKKINRPPKIIETDGIRYEYYEGDLLTSWFTIRNSGYEAISKCYFGSSNENEFRLLKEAFGPFGRK